MPVANIGVADIGVADIGENDIVIDPSTGDAVTNPILALAIKEGHFYKVKRGAPRTVVEWSAFMKKRRTYQNVPRNFGLTDEEVTLFVKCSKEVLVPIQMILRIWGKDTMRECVDFIVRKKIPVYRWPAVNPTRHGYFVFSGDIVRAIKSCQIDLEADHGAWQAYMIRVSTNYEKAKKKARLKREALLNHAP